MKTHRQNATVLLGPLKASHIQYDVQLIPAAHELVVALRNWQDDQGGECCQCQQ